jgi:predicted SnoaL-like aldol condensation-catalyzing enzyme
MTTEENKALAQHWLELWNRHELDQLAPLVAPAYVHHASTGEHITFAQFQQGFAAVLRAYPDMHYTLVHMLAEGEMVAVYLTAVGTH